MLPVPNTVPELVEQLGRTFSPFERLKILTRAWALLRRMTPEERLAVAARLGLDQADEVVEAIAERTGSAASPALLSLIERAQTQGTAHLPELLSDLRDPKRRGERLRQGARTVEAALAGDGTAPPWLPPAVAFPAPPPPPPPLRRAAAPVSPPQPAAPTPVAPPAAPSPQPTQPSPAPAPQAPAPVEPTVPSTPVAATPAAPPRPEPPPPAPPPAPVMAKPAKGDEALAGRLAATSSLVARFRLLREHLQGSKRLSAGNLRALLEVFPDGWSRRRALAAMFTAGAPASAAEVAALLDTLSSERDRLWCLGALAGSRQMSGTDREALLGTVASPVARRRLERRFGHSSP
ncbi:MAG TPA: hypothetical protein VE685_20695 [Thermoanaerobaculia bacterium]|nr:hypothetical protein [Thermoanaerobaculia bacterium]